MTAAALALLAATPFTVATFNMRTSGGFDKGERAWTNRLPRIVEIVESRGFDVIGAQEIKTNQLHDLRRELGGRGFADLGRGRLDGGRGEGAYIFYATNRFTCLDGGTFQLSETPDVAGFKSWGAAYPRTCVWARFRDLSAEGTPSAGGTQPAGGSQSAGGSPSSATATGGGEFLFYNTHLDHESEPARTHGMNLILERLAAATADGTPAFLVGDFNIGFAPGNAIARARDAMRDTADLSETPHTGPVGTFHAYNRTPRGTIDYIFATGPVRVLSHATCDEWPGGHPPSDHSPVAARVSIR